MKRMLWLSLVLLAGCSAPVHSDYKPEVDFAAYHTFALMPLPQSGPPADPGLMLRIGKPAQDAVTETLSSKGYQPADRDKADFVVNLKGSSLPRVDVTDWGYNYAFVGSRYGRGAYVGTYRNVDVRTYNERTVAVEIFENRSHELVWTGWMKEESNTPINPQKIKEVVQKILEKFPPPPKSTNTK